MKNLFLKSIVLFTLLAAVCSCSSEGEKIITTPLSISEKSFKTTAMGETKTFTLESPTDWYATTTGDKWITISPNSGKAGTTEVKVTVKPNDSGQSRIADVLFNTGKESVKISVMQEWSLYFALPCTEYSIGYGGGDVTIAGLPERGYTINIPVAARQWMKAVGNVLTIYSNLDEVARNAIISISDSVNKKECKRCIRCI